MKDPWPDLTFPAINLLSLNKETSPCVGMCKIENDICSGCLRTLDEISEWTLYDPAEKMKIMSRIEQLRTK